jgi:hypothetical protein
VFHSPRPAADGLLAKCRNRLYNLSFKADNSMRQSPSLSLSAHATTNTCSSRRRSLPVSPNLPFATSDTSLAAITSCTIPLLPLHVRIMHNGPCNTCTALARGAFARATWHSTSIDLCHLVSTSSLHPLCLIASRRCRRNTKEQLQIDSPTTAGRIPTSTTCDQNRAQGITVVLEGLIPKHNETLHLTGSFPANLPLTISGLLIPLELLQWFYARVSINKVCVTFQTRVGV